MYYVCGLTWMEVLVLKEVIFWNDSSYVAKVIDSITRLTKSSYVFVTDLESDMTWWSEEAQNYFGVARCVYDGKSDAEKYIHPDDLPIYLEGFGKRMQGIDCNEEFKYRVRNVYGEYRLFAAMTELIYNDEGKPKYFIGVLINKNYSSDIDPVTGLYSAKIYHEGIQKAISQSDNAVIIKIGLYRFNNLNMIYGFEYTDNILKGIAGKLKEIANGQAKVYRLEGSKFAMIYNNLSREELIELSEEIAVKMKNEIYVEERNVPLKVAIGAVIIDESTKDVSSLRSKVTYAVNLSKAHRQGELVIFNDEVKTKNGTNLELIKVIHKSIGNGCDGFYLNYQPIVESKTGKICGMEALLRWKKEPYGDVPPGMFIEWLESDSSMYELGKFVLKQALQDGMRFKRIRPDIFMNVNVAAIQLENKDFRGMVREIIDETGFPASDLCLELTERCRDLDIDFLKEETMYFQSLGIKCAIDDYGTGSASPSIVMKVPVDEIKVDMSFVRGIRENIINQSMVEGIIEFAKTTGIKTCIEGVEDAELEEFLRKYEATWFQGYHYSKPSDVEYIEKILI